MKKFEEEMDEEHDSGIGEFFYFICVAFDTLNLFKSLTFVVVFFGIDLYYYIRLILYFK